MSQRLHVKEENEAILTIFLHNSYRILLTEATPYVKFAK